MLVLLSLLFCSSCYCFVAHVVVVATPVAADVVVVVIHIWVAPIAFVTAGVGVVGAVFNCRCCCCFCSTAAAFVVATAAIGVTNVYVVVDTALLQL